MTPDRKAYPRSGHVFVALVLSMALWAVMVFWSLAYLRRIAGGLEPFDLRPFGYDIGDARALLGALSQLGRDYYLNTQLSLDNAFPATYALSRVLLLLWLTMLALGLAFLQTAAAQVTGRLSGVVQDSSGKGSFKNSR